MGANTTPIFGISANTSVAVISALNSSRDGSGTLVDIFTAGPNGSRVDSIDFTLVGSVSTANSALVWRVFITDESGNNPTLFRELAQAAVTPTTSVIGGAGNIPFGNGLGLRPGQKIKACQSAYADARDKTHVIVRGTDY